MKLKAGFDIKSVEGVHIVVPTGDNMSFSGVFTLNETALFVWNLLKEDISESDLVDKMSGEYDAPREVIEPDVKELIDAFKKNGFIEE